MAACGRCLMGGSSSAGFCCAYASPSTPHDVPLRTNVWTRETSAVGHRRGHKARPRQSKQSRQSKTEKHHASQGSMPQRESQARAGAYWRRRLYARRRPGRAAARARARGSPRTGRLGRRGQSAWQRKVSSCDLDLWRSDFRNLGTCCGLSRLKPGGVRRALLFYWLD